MRKILYNVNFTHFETMICDVVLLPPPRSLCFCLNLFVFQQNYAKTTQLIFPWNFVEGWDLGEERTHYILM